MWTDQYQLAGDAGRRTGWDLNALSGGGAHGRQCTQGSGTGRGADLEADHELDDGGEDDGGDDADGDHVAQQLRHEVGRRVVVPCAPPASLYTCPEELGPGSDAGAAACLGRHGHGGTGLGGPETFSCMKTRSSRRDHGAWRNIHEYTYMKTVTVTVASESRHVCRDTCMRTRV